MKLTKTAMLDYIEQSNMVIDFDRNYLMRRTRIYIEELYQRAQSYCNALQSWSSVIHKLLKDAERKADSIGYPIDEDQRYKTIHTILVDWECGDRILSGENKEYIAKELEHIYTDLNMDMWGKALRYIEQSYTK